MEKQELIYRIRYEQSRDEWRVYRVISDEPEPDEAGLLALLLALLGKGKKK